MKYRYYIAGKKVICVTMYAGKSVRGVAICSEDDTFNFDAGQRLAKARCDHKLAERRMSRIEKELQDIANQQKVLANKHNKLIDSLMKANTSVEDAKEQVNSLVSGL